MSHDKLQRHASDHDTPAKGSAADDGAARAKGGGDGYFSTVGGSLDGATRGRMEGSFGQGFGDVEVHRDSPRASGSTHALTDGNQIHFAPGRYQPGTTGGDRLIAHELSHVVQQRGGGQSVQHFDEGASRGLLEVDADRAADRAVAGQAANVRFRATPGSLQLFDSYEHHQLGMDGGAGRSVTLKCGVVLTYGEVVAMSGDFYGTPEALLNAPKEEVLKIRDVMAGERVAAAAGHGHVDDKFDDANTEKLQGATAWRERTAYDGGGNKLTTGKDDAGNDRSSQGEAQGAEPQSYLTLAAGNSTHFSPDNINQRWRPQHDVALKLAKEAYRSAQKPADATAAAGHATDPGAAARDQATEASRAAVRDDPKVQAANADAKARATANAPDTLKKTQAAMDAAEKTGEFGAGSDKMNAALLHDGFGCHFITDAFASGHLISGETGRKVGTAYWGSHSAAVIANLKSAANRDFPHVPHGIIDGAVDKLTSQAEFVANFGSLCLKLVHDKLNDTPLTVANPRGDTWQTMGDGNLADAPQSAVFGAEAVRLSREAVEETARTGECRDPYAAIQVVPSVVSFAGSMLSVAAFAENPTIFEAFLTPRLMDGSQNNPLYKKIKGNVAMFIGQKVKEGAVGIGQGAAALGRRGVNAVEQGVSTGVNVVETGVARGVDGAKAGAKKVAGWVESLF